MLFLGLGWYLPLFLQQASDHAIEIVAVVSSSLRGRGGRSEHPKLVFRTTYLPKRQIKALMMHSLTWKQFRVRGLRVPRGQIFTQWWWFKILQAFRSVTMPAVLRQVLFTSYWSELERLHKPRKLIRLIFGPLFSPLPLDQIFLHAWRNLPKKLSLIWFFETLGVTFITGWDYFRCFDDVAFPQLSEKLLQAIWTWIS